MRLKTILPEKLLVRLDQVDSLVNKCALILSELLAGEKATDDFFLFDAILVAMMVYLADCDLLTNDEKIGDDFEKNLRKRFSELIKINQALALLPQTEEQSLRKLARAVKQVSGNCFLGKREEYINDLIASLTVAADEVARQKNSGTG